MSADAMASDAATLITPDAPAIRSLLEQIAHSQADDVAIATSIHDWVRDEIQFGFMPAFYQMTASEVLAARAGYCNTKATLFVSLLRAAGIPARIRVFDLSAIVLDGLIDPATPYVDHSITEVRLNKRWLGVDSYVVDRPLADAARRRLSNSTKRAGFGVHLGGTSDWDGHSNSFIQCVDDGSIDDYILRDHGVFDDIDQFYRLAPNPRNKLNHFTRLFLWLGSQSINARIEAVRRST
ncbi:MAG: transglutaminase family protein [Burkholderiaceae bacterium]